jgi:hypothetical protein
VTSIARHRALRLDQRAADDLVAERLQAANELVLLPSGGSRSLSRDECEQLACNDLRVAPVRRSIHAPSSSATSAVSDEPS